ncbi:hypothetical protein E8E13_002953 [Curvularia kusanoi]|uniref:NACHT domain-containing protein n=1 Tax=Curvularia kusanoi TaxID=90978 RepID=A0A9P4T5D3_CURKU|nr:hypothetical protein E8E13_002953 [Curvularia kusanoi]
MATQPPVASAQARVVLQSAFDRFHIVVSQNDRHVFTDTTLQDVRKEALQIEQGLRRRGTQQNMLRLEPFLKGLERYSKAMEVLCNGTPFLPWIWAPVKLLLLSALDALSAFEKLIEAYGKIAHVLPRLERYTAAFNHDPNFQNTLALVYADILEVHRHSYKFVCRKSWAILFGSTWARFETRFTGILERLAYHSDLLDREAYAINISETLRHSGDQARRWEQEDAELEASKYHTVLTWLKMNETSQDYIFRKHCDGSISDSSDWFINQDKMQRWKSDRSENAWVWITGKPGAGKSVLCSNIVRSLRSTGTEVLYYFCSYLGDSSDRCSRLLRSLACQIVEKRKDLAMHVYDTYYVAHGEPNTLVTMQLLQELLMEMGSTRIVIDGVDEWKEHQRELLTHLKKLTLTDPNVYTCKILISSRDTFEVSRNFVRRSKSIAFSNLSDEFESSEIRHSISCFVEVRLKDLPSHFDDLDPSGTIMAHVKRKLLEKSNGDLPRNSE